MAGSRDAKAAAPGNGNDPMTVTFGVPESVAPPTGFGSFFGESPTMDSDAGLFFGEPMVLASDAAGPFFGTVGASGEPSWQDDPAVRSLIPDTGGAEAVPTDAAGDRMHEPEEPRYAGTFVFVNGVATVVPLILN